MVEDTRELVSFSLFQAISYNETRLSPILIIWWKIQENLYLFSLFQRVAHIHNYIYIICNKAKIPQIASESYPARLTSIKNMTTFIKMYLNFSLYTLTITCVFSLFWSFLLGRVSTGGLFGHRLIMSSAILIVEPRKRKSYF